MNAIFSLKKSGFIVLIAVVLAGCANPGQTKLDSDPLESYNRAMYKFNDTLDSTIVRPVAETYRDVVPDPINKGISNFFSNIGDINNALQNFLQLKVDEAVSDLSRVMINTTFGLFGIFDVASEAGIEKHSEDFGQTLAVWGVDSGPYIVLPFFGPSTLRDGVGFGVDWKTDALNEVEPDSSDRLKLTAVKYLDVRADLLKASDLLQESIDPYAFMKNAYAQKREKDIYDGNPPVDEFMDFQQFDDMMMDGGAGGIDPFAP